MKILKNSMLIAATVLASQAFAGGPVIEQAMPHLFVSLEGGYTWNKVGNTAFSFTDAPFFAPPVTFSGLLTKTNHGGTGRLAMGAIHYSTMNPNLSYTGELGWGYYGSTNFNTPTDIYMASNYIFGLDLLAGIDYRFNHMFDFFFKLGGLVENVRLNRSFSLTAIGLPFTTITKTTVSSVLPEIKLGGTFDFSDCWGLSLAYMHAFGNSPYMSINNTFTPGLGVIASNVYSLGAPITLNTVLAGLVYKFD